jgi:hypothetical protein
MQGMRGRFDLLIFQHFRRNCMSGCGLLTPVAKKSLGYNGKGKRVLRE